MNKHARSASHLRILAPLFTLLAAFIVPLPPSAAAPGSLALDEYPCAPLDIVFLLDTTGSMRPAIENVQSEVVDVVSDIDAVSGGGYRVGVVNFSDEGITVDAAFSPRNADAAKAAISALKVPSGGGQTSPEMWDEALASIVENRSAADVSALKGAGQQEGDFGVGWRPEAEKIVVLVADSSPGGFDQEYQKKDLDRAFAVAVKAKTKGIRIATIMVPHEYRGEGAESFLRAVADLSASSYQATLPDASNLAEGLRLNVKTCAADTDGDGLFDTWEKDGYDADGDGRVDVDLPAMGADPRHKDLFLQVNWMALDGARPCTLGILCLPRTDEVVAPDPEALGRAVAMFADSPVENPDGDSGIALHIDAGMLSPQGSGVEQSTMRGGPMSESRAELLQDTRCGAGLADSDRGMLGDLRAEYVPDERDAVYTWAIYARKITGTGCLGMAVDVPGDTYMLAGSLMKSTLLEASTFVHELGHTLGLRHGGLDDVNGKPNYLSLMNYDYNLGDGLIRDDKAGVLDYSRFDLAPLDLDAGLEESIGVVEVPGTLTPQGYGILYHCADGDGGSADLRSAKVLSPVDWNCDGDASDSEITGSVARGGEYPEEGILSSRNDWTSITFSGGLRGGLQTIGEPVDEEGLDYQSWRQTAREYAVEVFDPGTVDVGRQARQVRVLVAIRNVGLERDSYVVSSAGQGDWRPETVDTTVQVEPDSTGLATVDVPLNEAWAETDVPLSLTVSVQSQSADWVEATRTITLQPVDVREPNPDAELSVSPGEPSAGKPFVVAADGFSPDTPVMVVSDQDWFEPVAAQSDSTGAISVEVPGASVAGQGEVSAIGVAPSTDMNPNDVDPTELDGSSQEEWMDPEPETLVEPGLLELQPRIAAAQVVVVPGMNWLPRITVGALAGVGLLVVALLLRRNRRRRASARVG